MLTSFNMDVPLLPGAHPRRPATISHQTPALVTTVFRLLTLVISAGYIHIASARATQKTPPPTVSPLLRVTSRCLAIDVSLVPQVLL